MILNVCIFNILRLHVIGNLRMAKPTYEELVQRVKTLEEELTTYKLTQKELKRAREQELQLLEMTAALSRELNLGNLLSKIIHTASTLLSADKCTLFMYDDNTHELWARVTLDSRIKDLRFPSHVGIVGSAFTTGKSEILYS